jgi:hypothetical protein
LTVHLGKGEFRVVPCCLPPTGPSQSRSPPFLLTRIPGTNKTVPVPSPFSIITIFFTSIVELMHPQEPAEDRSIVLIHPLAKPPATTTRTGSGQPPQQQQGQPATMESRSRSHDEHSQQQRPPQQPPTMSISAATSSSRNTPVHAAHQTSGPHSTQRPTKSDLTSTKTLPMSALESVMQSMHLVQQQETKSRGTKQH